MLGTAAAQEPAASLPTPRAPRKSNDVLLPSDMAKARDRFAAFDLDGSGLLEIDELCTWVATIGHEITADRMRELIAPFDRRHLGALDFESFTHMLAALGGHATMLRPKVELCTEALLGVIDADKDGKATPAGADGAKPPRVPQVDAGYAGWEAAGTRIPADKLHTFEQRLSEDFGLSLRISDLIEGPITEEKIWSFMVESN